MTSVGVHLLLLLLLLIGYQAESVDAWFDCDEVQTSRLRVRAIGVRNNRLLVLTDAGIFDEDVSAWNPRAQTIRLSIAGWVRVD